RIKKPQLEVIAKAPRATRRRAAAMQAGSSAGSPRMTFSAQAPATVSKMTGKPWVAGFRNEPGIGAGGVAPGGSPNSRFSIPRAGGIFDAIFLNPVRMT
ncbi:hypothetical protein, partial [Mesorhizobium sp. WSM2561]|uniref:hypothetical protein n=1 Tax=Mesorhizobium sp. WSM2561 TaxID=1040985 RepID=UPI001AEBA9D4